MVVPVEQRNAYMAALKEASVIRTLSLLQTFWRGWLRQTKKHPPLKKWLGF